MQQQENTPSVTLEFVTDFLRQNRPALEPTQDKICLPVLNRLYTKMLAGIRFPPISVYESWIIEGHHRYLASLLAAYDLEHTPSGRSTGAKCTDWLRIEFVTNDWDSRAKILHLNRQDAIFNAISLERITEIIL